MSSFRRALIVLGVGLTVASLPATAASPQPSAQPSDQDVSWMAAAHRSNLGEIAAGNAALRQGTTAQVRDLAAMFIAAHGELDAALTTTAEDLGVPLPAAPTAEQRRQLAGVTARTGPAFDTAWLALQRAGHQAAVEGAQNEVDNGHDPAVVGLARTTLPVIQQHLRELDAAIAGAGAPRQVAGGSGGQAAERSVSWPGVAAALAGAILLGGGALLVARSRRVAA